MKIIPCVIEGASLSLGGLATEALAHKHQSQMHGRSGMHNSGSSMDHHKGSHRHARWIKAPEEYAALRWHTWGSSIAAKRGEQNYSKHCQQCHGADGRGFGPLAKSLPHKPADLTHHFHSVTGKTDGYLFWRISEGGVVQPFQSSNSTMPAFKSVLSVDERWDVLIYIHREFHKGFIDKK